MCRLSRRAFLARASSLCAATALGRVRPAPRGLPPVRQITRGPAHHWFGYYDKLEVNPSGQRVLGMEVDFEHRSPRADDEIRIGYVDLRENDAWTELGRSRAWGWQQGCMLQWRPRSEREVLWNDRDGDRFVARLLDVESGAMRSIDRPIYTISPDGKTALGLDFERVQHMRPGYGYAGVDDPNRDKGKPSDAGIYLIDLESGESRLVVPIERIAEAAEADRDLEGAVHYFNHLLFNTDGTRFVFLHRWRQPGKRGFATRMLTATPGGEDVRVVDDSGHTSHFIWRDPAHVLAWTRHESAGSAFYLFEDREDGDVDVVGRDVMVKNGHCTYLPGNEWILNDTYPDRDRLQHPYLFHVETGRVVPLGHFESPAKYRGEWRCDTHPRSSPDGKAVIIDSPHGGDGRQLHLIDVSEIVG